MRPRITVHENPFSKTSSTFCVQTVAIYRDSMPFFSYRLDIWNAGSQFRGETRWNLILYCSFQFDKMLDKACRKSLARYPTGEIFHLTLPCVSCIHWNMKFWFLIWFSLSEIIFTPLADYIAMNGSQDPLATLIPIFKIHAKSRWLMSNMSHRLKLDVLDSRQK